MRVMVRASEGSDALRRVVYPEISITELSRLTGMTQHRIIALTRGTAEPSASEMALLKKHAGIPLEAWVRPAAK